jgi:hypothetical protein
MSSASTKRISTDSAPADPLDTLLGRFDVLVTAIETLAGDLEAVAQRLLQEAASKSIQSTVASSVDLLDSSAWVKELEASAAFSAREAERVSLQSENLLEFANSDTRKSFDVRAKQQRLLSFAVVPESVQSRASIGAGTESEAQVRLCFKECRKRDRDPGWKHAAYSLAASARIQPVGGSSPFHSSPHSAFLRLTCPPIRK